MRVDAERLEDRLDPLEPVQVTGEAQVGRLLDRYGIPFFYEKPLIVHDRASYRLWHHGLHRTETPGDIDPGVPACRRSPIRRNPAQAGGLRRNSVPAVFIYPDDLKGRDRPEVCFRVAGARRPGCSKRRRTVH